MPNEKTEKPNLEPNRADVEYIQLSKRKYQIYYYLVKKGLCQKQIQKRIDLAKSTIHQHVKKLETLGVIKPIEPNANPKFYEATNIIPKPSWKKGKKQNTVINQNTQKKRKLYNRRVLREREEGETESGVEGRDYDSVVSRDGRLLKVLRVHSVSYSCKVLEGFDVDGWERVGSPNGMEQFRLKHTFSDGGDVSPCLRSICVTFLYRKYGRGDGDLVIYMPEKYVFEYELDDVVDELQRWVWEARKWFMRCVGGRLSLPVQYRSMEVARKVDDRGVVRVLREHGMVKADTEGGYAVVDESKKGFPEREFTSLDEVKADLRLPSRVLGLEDKLSRVEDVLERAVESVRVLSERQSEMLDVLERGRRKDLSSQNREDIGRGAL